MLISILDYFGTVVFALSGVLLASYRRLDIFGALVLAGVTAIGGGTIRDIVLDAPVFWLQQPAYLWTIIATWLVSISLVKPAMRDKKLFQWADAIGLATFVIIGIEKSLAWGASPIVAVFMGMLTGCGGGMIRDVLTGKVPSVLKSEFYATACICGGIAQILTLTLLKSELVSFVVSFAVTLSLRLLAIRYHWHLPHLRPSQD